MTFSKAGLASFVDKNVYVAFANTTYTNNLKQLGITIDWNRPMLVLDANDYGVHVQLPTAEKLNIYIPMSAQFLLVEARASAAGAKERVA